MGSRTPDYWMTELPTPMTSSTTIIQRWRISEIVSIKGIRTLAVKVTEVCSTMIGACYYLRGEFLEDRYTVTSLTAQDLIILKDEGYYVEPPPAKEVEDDEAFLKAKMLATNSKKQKEQVGEASVPVTDTNSCDDYYTIPNTASIGVGAKGRNTAQKA